MPSRQSLGRWGEALAADYLTQAGYTIIERNARTSYGELDLVTQMGDQLVFIEVKTRASTTLGPPEISVTPSKQSHLLAAINDYTQSNPSLGDDWRVDVIAILQLPGQKPQIEHFENILSGLS